MDENNLVLYRIIVFFVFENIGIIDIYTSVSCQIFFLDKL